MGRRAAFAVPQFDRVGDLLSDQSQEEPLCRVSLFSSILFAIANDLNQHVWRRHVH